MEGELRSSFSATRDDDEDQRSLRKKHNEVVTGRYWLDLVVVVLDAENEGLHQSVQRHQFFLVPVSARRDQMKWMKTVRNHAWIQLKWRTEGEIDRNFNTLIILQLSSKIKMAYSSFWVQREELGL